MSPGFARRSLAAVWEYRHMMAAGYSRIALQAVGASWESPAPVCQQDKPCAAPLQGGSSGALT